MQTLMGVSPFRSDDPDSKRIFWRDGGVHQNITHAVHPDPISGMHAGTSGFESSAPMPMINMGISL